MGKTSLIQQFVYNEFSEEYNPTTSKQTFYPSVIINEHMYEVKLVDIPVLPYFPVNALYEWSEFRCYGVRNATAYVLVYDLLEEETFTYLKTIREQIIASRNMHSVPVYVVGNKHDKTGNSDIYRRDFMNLVQKTWKCGYIETSAKYDWQVVPLFKDLMTTIDYIDYGNKPTTTRNVVCDVLSRQKCVVL